MYLGGGINLLDSFYEVHVWNIQLLFCRVYESCILVAFQLFKSQRLVVLDLVSTILGVTIPVNIKNQFHI